MNLTSTTQHIQTDQSLSGRSSQLLRLSGAANAQGFAQVMRAFAAEDRSSPAENMDESARSEGLTDESSDRSGQTDAAGVGDGEDDSAEPDSPECRGPHPATSGEKPQPASDAAASENAPPAPRQDAEMRLLDSQSEQAKLSMKGLLRSLIRGGGADTTSVAVETRLAPAEPGPQPARPVEPAPADRPATPEPQQQASPARHPSASLSDEIPDSPRDDGDRPVREPAAAAARGTSVGAGPDQARADVQQARSVRADAAAQVQTHQPPQATASGRLTPVAAAEQAARMTRTESSANSVRAVTGNESAQLGSALKDTGAGTLAERVGRTPVPTMPDRTAVMAQIQRGLASMMRSGKGDMTLKLTPGHLGEVRIRIKSDGDRLAVRLEATTDEASDLLNAGVKDLAVALRGKGVQLEHLSIEQRQAGENLDNAGTQGEQPTSHDQNPGRRRGAADAGGEQVDEASGFGGEHDDDPDAIWTELGLDAIA